MVKEFGIKAIERLTASLAAPTPLQRVLLEDVQRQVLALGKPLSPGQRERVKSLLGEEG